MHYVNFEEQGGRKEKKNPEGLWSQVMASHDIKRSWCPWEAYLTFGFYSAAAEKNRDVACALHHKFIIRT